MEALTAALAIVGAVLVARSTPLKGLVIYMCVLCWYSAWQPLTIAGVNFTAARVVMPFVLWQAMRDKGLLRRFRWNWADTLVLFIAGGEIVSGSLTTPLDALIQNRAGAFFDQALVYFAARLAIGTKEDYVYFLKAMLVVAAPIGVLGVYQSVTGMNPWGSFVSNGTFGAQAVDKWSVESMRMGLYRAYVNFPYPITFGFFFALVVAAAAGLWKAVPRHRRRLVAAGIVAAAGGMMSSMSSGPVLAAVAAGGVIAGWPFRRYWKVALGCVVAALAAVDIASNRSWYDVLAWYFTFNVGTAAYRIELIREAFGTGMRDHWLAGFGLVTPETIHAVVSHWKHTDIANHFIFQTLQFGLLGFVPWAAFAATTLARLRRGYLAAGTASLQWLLWCTGAAVAGVLASMMSACWEGQPYNVFFALMGAAASAPTMAQAEREAVARRQRVSRRRAFYPMGRAEAQAN